MYIWGITKRFKALSWLDNFMSGHISIGRRVTVFGQNAMHWSVSIYGTKWGSIHIDLPTPSRLIGKRGWCIYASPNGTPWACTWYIGNADKHESLRAKIRLSQFGHNFNTNGPYSGSDLYKLNELMETIKFKTMANDLVYKWVPQN